MGQAASGAREQEAQSTVSPNRQDGASSGNACPHNGT